MIKYNSLVEKIQWGGAKPVVQYKNLHENRVESIEADKVIVTVSLGVLKEQHNRLFEPTLPAKKVTAIETLQFAIVNKIFLTFEQPWWPEEANLHILWTGLTEKQLSVRLQILLLAPLSGIFPNFFHNLLRVTKKISSLWDFFWFLALIHFYTPPRIGSKLFFSSSFISVKLFFNNS